MDTMTYLAASDRYDDATYRRCGRSGLNLPAISLGLWHNFGDREPLETQRAILRRAFDSGVTLSTWPTTTARPTAVRSATSARCSPRTSARTVTS
jgi:hypothetical protein